MSEPIRLQEWLDNHGKWVHLRVQPPKDSHDVTINQCDGKLPWRGTIYPSAEDIAFASDARLVDVRYGPPDPEGDPICPEFKGGRFFVTFQLPTSDGVETP